jgi:dTDP-glucose 4,6-dehydratase
MTEKQTLLLTGGSGFIGTNMVRLLLDSGMYRIINLDALTYAANPFSLEDLESNPDYEFVRGNITDRELVSTLFSKYRPAGVMHLAAESHVDRSIVSADDFVQTNVVGTYTLLEAARLYWNGLSAEEKKNFRFLHVSTDEVFGDLPFDGGVFDEQTAYKPSSPYSASKAASDHFARAWWHTYALPTIVSNCSNNYGPYHFPEKLIPLTILNALEGKPLPVYGAGANVRDWLFVEDHARALRAVLEKGEPGETYLVGGRAERTNLEVVHAICDLLDARGKLPGGKPRRDLVSFVADRPGHDRRYAIDPSKVERELGWKPLETFDSGLARTVDWYLANEDWWRPLRERYGGERLGKLG